MTLESEEAAAVTTCVVPDAAKTSGEAAGGQIVRVCTSG